MNQDPSGPRSNFFFTIPPGVTYSRFVRLGLLLRCSRSSLRVGPTPHTTSLEALLFFFQPRKILAVPPIPTPPLLFNFLFALRLFGSGMRVLR